MTKLWRGILLTLAIAAVLLLLYFLRNVFYLLILLFLIVFIALLYKIIVFDQKPPEFLFKKYRTRTRTSSKK